MKTTGIRLEVEPWLYNVLIEEQEGRRQKTGRKHALSTLILEFCTKGLSFSRCFLPVSGNFVQKKSDFEQKKDDPVQNFEGSVQQNSVQNALLSPLNLDEIAKLKETLLRKEQDLLEKERGMALREQEIADKETELEEKALRTLEHWNDLLDSKEQSMQKSNEKILQKLEMDHQSKELTEKTELIKNLKKENERLKEHTLKILQKIDRQTEKNILLDYIVPFLPSIISIIGFFITNKKIENIQELNPIQTEIGNMMKKLSDTDKEKLSTKLEESLKSFSALRKGDDV
jgi:hypothetical protein